MNGLLLIEATEEMQTLAEGLARAGLRVSTCSLDEAAGRLASGELIDALRLNLMDGTPDDAVRKLLRAESLPAHVATIAILRHEQLAQLDPELPVDDFVVFPAPPEELAARLQRAVRRRSGDENAHLLRCGDLTIDQAKYKVFVANRPVDLTYKEYELLRFLALNQAKVCTREMLLDQVWGYDFYGGSRTVDVHIRRLRSKIEDRGHTFIETVRNVGYRFYTG